MGPQQLWNTAVIFLCAIHNKTIQAKEPKKKKLNTFWVLKKHEIVFVPLLSTSNWCLFFLLSVEPQHSHKALHCNWTPSSQTGWDTLVIGTWAVSYFCHSVVKSVYLWSSILNTEVKFKCNCKNSHFRYDHMILVVSLRTDEFLKA